MNTRRKNKSAHPGIPDMTPSQLSSAGLSRTPAAGGKKLTKNAQIVALQDEVRSLRELISSSRSDSCAEREDQMQMSQDAGGDTDPATDTEEMRTAATGAKRKSSGPVSSAPRLKRSRAIDPFESSSMVHAGATGLVDDWRTIISPYGTASPQHLTLNLRTPDRNASLLSPTSSATMTSRASTPSTFSFRETPSVPTFTLPRIIKGVRVNPGIKDLPEHLRQNFRNEFIRFVVKQVANSDSPWINPDVDSLQCMYQLVYPTFPGRIRHSDAVYHPTITALGILRNHLAVAAIAAIHRHIPRIFRSKRLQTVETRAQYVTQLFKSEDDHPIIWREYVEGDIQNHPEVGGYKTTRRGVFQSDPILETLLSYYSSSGIMESLPSEDPGPGNRPVGVLALVTVAVERAYGTYATGDFIEPSHQFGADFWGPKTARYMDYITNDLNERHWNSIFTSLSYFAVRASKEEAIRNGAPEAPRERVPLPPSDPPSPPRDD